MIRDAAPRSSKLSRLLGEISRRRALGELPEQADPALAGGAKDADVGRGGREAGADGPVSVGIEEILPGGVLDGPRGPVFVHERLRSEIERPRTGWGKLTRNRRGRGGRPGPEWMWEDAEVPMWGEPDPGTAGADEALTRDESMGIFDEAGLAPEALHAELESLLHCDLRRIVFLDLETGGLGSACVFLAGTMRWNGCDFVLRQYFARNYAEEAGLLGGLSADLAAADAIITFNGKSFDVPLLRDRCIRNRLELRVPPLHVDLLHHARAAWRGRVPNCRLVTLEAYVCRRRRSGDIPGDEIPGLYHDYVRSGLAHRLIPVFHHNLLDVITMDELLRRLI